MFSLILAWWIGPRFSAPFILLLGLAVWTTAECCGGAVAMFLNGASLMRFQVVSASIFGLTCLAVKIYFARRFGTVAVLWATLLTYLSIVGVSYAIYVPRALPHLHRVPNPVITATPVIEE